MIKRTFTKNSNYYITIFIIGLFILTSVVSIGFGALNQNLNISSDIEYEKNIENLIMSWTSSSTTDFHNATYKTKIKSIEFLNNATIPSNAVESWNVSKSSSPGRVNAWVIADPDNAGYYKLYIGANGVIIANEDSSNMFNGFSTVVSINFNNNFDTSRVTNMAGMFRGCNGLKTLDLINFVTTSVTNMSRLFYGCSNLNDLNVKKFSTKAVTNMSYMFYGCRSLTSLSITNFNTTQVTDMSYMFYNCTGLPTLTIWTFNTKKVTNMSYMFRGCSNLTAIKVKGPLFNVNNVTNSTQMFQGCTKLYNYDSRYVDKTKAKSTNQGGYLTYVSE